MRKVMFSTILCALCLIISSMFVGCGETRTFKEVSGIYDAILGEYRGVFFTTQNEVNITYSSSIQTKINTATEESLYYNLKKDDSNSAAIFEPALKANVFVTSYFINWDLEAYNNVPSGEMNSLYSQAKSLRTALYDLSRVKTRMQSASNPDGDIVDYRQKFYEVIKSFNDFSTHFLNVFEKYVNVDTTPQGRISVAKTQLEFAKKVIETVSLVSHYYIKDSINKSFAGDDVISTNFVAIYREAKEVFQGEKFQSILNRSKTEPEEKMIQELKNVENYNSFFYNETKRVQNILKDYSLSALKEKQATNQLTEDEQILLNKLYDFSHTFAVMKTYMVGYKDALIEFNNAE